jgi:hypothetical protein
MTPPRKPNSKSPRRRRRRPLFEQGRLIQRHASFAESELDDLPVLTDVDERLEPSSATRPIILEPPGARLANRPAPPTARPTSPSASSPRHRDQPAHRGVGRHRAPQLVSRELDDLAERLQATAAAHLRATLLPLISAEIADTLDKGPEA